MSKKKHQARQKLAKALVSVFVLAVFIIPTFLTGKWVVSAFGTRDPRTLVATTPFVPRKIDTNNPLKPFDEPMVSVTFDDGWESIYTKAFPILQKEGIHTTQYVITGMYSNYPYMSVAQLHAMQKAGHDIASHTKTHSDLTTLDDTQLIHELVDPKDSITKEFGETRDFTSPYGAYNAHTLKVIGMYYRSQKNAEGDPAANELEAINIANGFESLNFKSYSVRQTTTTNDIKKLLKAAQDNNAWLVLTYHQIDYSGETFSVSPEVFQEQMKIVSNSPLRSATVGQFFDAYAPRQKEGY